MIVNHQGKPYSKRDGSAFVGEFRERGFMSEALFNYLALLGWAPGDDREKMTRAELVDTFTLDRVKSAPAQMDIKKLTHLNAQYIAELPKGRFVEDARRVLASASWAADAQADYLERVAEIMQIRTHVFTDVLGWRYYFAEDFEFEEKAVRKGLKKEGTGRALSELAEKLGTVDFSEEDVETAIRGIEAAHGIKQGKLNFPVRVAVTGSSTGAGIYETMVLLGRERVVKRLKYSAEQLCG
jgi:glutamyl/glutaminyl-tRNA synthetase